MRPETVQAYYQAAMMLFLVTGILKWKPYAVLLALLLLTSVALLA
jgi:hypothetical protein